jgi:hypothetical protein
LIRRWIKEGRLNRRAVIVGGGHEAEELIKALEASHLGDGARSAERARFQALKPDAGLLTMCTIS